VGDSGAVLNIALLLFVEAKTRLAYWPMATGFAQRFRFLAVCRPIWHTS
jgi:hypothetical protein